MKSCTLQAGSTVLPNSLNLSSNLWGQLRSAAKGSKMPPLPPPIYVLCAPPFSALLDATTANYGLQPNLEQCKLFARYYMNNCFFCYYVRSSLSCKPNLREWIGNNKTSPLPDRTFRIGACIMRVWSRGLISVPMSQGIVSGRALLLS